MVFSIFDVTSHMGDFVNANRGMTELEPGVCSQGILHAHAGVHSIIKHGKKIYTPKRVSRAYTIVVIRKLFNIPC